jgi:hypothetical protein
MIESFYLVLYCAEYLMFAHGFVFIVYKYQFDYANIIGERTFTCQNISVDN